MSTSHDPYCRLRKQRPPHAPRAAEGRMPDRASPGSRRSRNLLALEAEAAPKGKPARSVIMLWPRRRPRASSTPLIRIPARRSAAACAPSTRRFRACALPRALEQTASVMQDVSLIRSMVSKEGDHERAIYNIKTGYRPIPALTHPSIGAIVCHELPDAKIEIPTHVSILPDRWPARGGFFGAEYDAFQIGDPAKPVPDVRPRGGEETLERRLADLAGRGARLCPRPPARSRSGKDAAPTHACKRRGAS